MKILILLFLLFPLSSFAEIFEVHSVAPKNSQPDIWMVKFMDGRVGFWAQEGSEISPSDLERTVIDAQLSETHNLTDIRIVGQVNNTTPEVSLEKILPGPRYTPVVYPTYNFATQVLNGMRRSWVRGSQCYDRSHIWAYEEAYTGRLLQKAFLFFSDAYISRYNYQWWFHTAPYALVKLNGEVVERVMDPAFSQYPLKFKLWTDMFMKNKAECKLVPKYSDYSAHPGEDDCYIIKSSIYFWQPKDLEAYEKSGVEKKKFIDWEVRHAYENAFNISL